MSSVRGIRMGVIALVLPALAADEDFAQQGRQALKRKEYGKAIKANPKDAANYSGRGGAYVEKKRNGDAFPGIVTDDTGIFTAARRHGLAVEAFDVLLPEPAFQFFVAALGNEKQQSQYSYGFPDGDGDCNCVTWIERLGLPLLTGRMDEFIALPGRASYPSRRFGRCL